MSNRLTENLFYLFIFFLPWQTFFIIKETYIENEKFQYGTIGIYLSEIILFFWILANLNIFKKYPNKKLLFSVSAFILFIALSVFWSTNKLLSFYYLLPFLLGSLSFLIIQKKFLSFKKFVFVFVFSVSLQGLLGLNQFLNQADFSNKWLGLSHHLAEKGGTAVIETDSSRFLRAYGGMPHPNIFGGFLIIAILLSIGAYSKSNSKEKLWRYFLILTTLINFSALLASFSRSSILAFFFGFLLYFIYNLINKKTFSLKQLLFLTSALCIISLFFLLSMPDLFKNRISKESRLENKSIEDRRSLNIEAWENIQKNTLLGVGLGNYTYSIVKNNEVHREIWNIQPVHNIYLLICSEIGLVGFSLFLFIVVFVVWDFFESFKKEDTNRVIFSIITLSLLVLSFFDHWLWTLHAGIIIFWIFLGFSREKNIYTT